MEGVDLYSIDPGVRYFGCGSFSRGRLVDCAYQYVPDLVHLPLMPCCYFVCESQYMGATPTVLGLARMTGALVSRSVDYTLYKPSVWKGTASKKRMHARILACLDDEERAIFLATTQTYRGPDKRTEKWRSGLTQDMAYDVSHGIGVGLHHLGRLRKNR